MMKSNNVSAQKALTYCIYMMVSGNFAGCREVNPCMEKRLRLEYKTQKDKEQQRFEDAAARLADKFFLRKLPQNIWDENPRVVLKCPEKSNVAEVIFLGESWKLRIVGFARGKANPKFLYSFTENVNGKDIEKSAKPTSKKKGKKAARTAA